MFSFYFSFYNRRPLATVSPSTSFSDGKSICFFCVGALLLHVQPMRSKVHPSTMGTACWDFFRNLWSSFTYPRRSLCWRPSCAERLLHCDLEGVFAQRQQRETGMASNCISSCVCLFFCTTAHLLNKSVFSTNCCTFWHHFAGNKSPALNTLP